MIENKDGEKKGNETGDEAMLVGEGMVTLDSMEPVGNGTGDEARVWVEEGMVMSAGMDTAVVDKCEPVAAGEMVSLLAGLMLFGRSLIARIALLIAEITRS